MGAWQKTAGHCRALLGYLDRFLFESLICARRPLMLAFFSSSAHCPAKCAADLCAVKVQSALVKSYATRAFAPSRRVSKFCPIFTHIWSRRTIAGGNEFRKYPKALRDIFLRYCFFLKTDPDPNLYWLQRSLCIRTRNDPRRSSSTPLGFASDRHCRHPPGYLQREGPQWGAHPTATKKVLGLRRRMSSSSSSCIRTGPRTGAPL